MYWNNNLKQLKSWHVEKFLWNTREKNDILLIMPLKSWMFFFIANKNILCKYFNHFFFFFSFICEFCVYTNFSTDWNQRHLWVKYKSKWIILKCVCLFICWAVHLLKIQTINLLNEQDGFFLLKKESGKMVNNIKHRAWITAKINKIYHQVITMQIYQVRIQQCPRFSFFLYTTNEYRTHTSCFALILFIFIQFLCQKDWFQTNDFWHRCKVTHTWCYFCYRENIFYHEKSNCLWNSGKPVLIFRSFYLIEWICNFHVKQIGFFHFCRINIEGNFSCFVCLINRLWCNHFSKFESK